MTILDTTMEDLTPDAVDSLRRKHLKFQFDRFMHDPARSDLLLALIEDLTLYRIWFCTGFDVKK